MVEYADDWSAGPLSAPYVRKSKLLADYLKTVSEPQKIQSPVELAARLGTVFLADKADKTNDKKLKSAQKQDLDNETAMIIAGLGNSLGHDTPPANAPDPNADLQRQIIDGVDAQLDGRPRAPIMAAPRSKAPITESELSPVAQAPADDSSSPPTTPGAPATQQPSSRDLDLLARTLIGEAGNQSAEGQQAVAQVILNRARQTGMSIPDVIMAPGQFEPWNNPKKRAELEAIDPSSPQYQIAMANAQAARDGTANLPPGVASADHFYSPKSQAALGRQPPSWDNGSGTDLGAQRFFQLGYGGQPAPPMVNQPSPQNPVPGLTAANGGHPGGLGSPPIAPAPPNQPQLSMPELAGPQGGAQPFQIAQNGGLPPMPSSAAGGAPPAPQPPQGDPQGQPLQANPNAPTQQELQLYRSLMATGDPQKVAQARQFAEKLRERSLQRPQYDVQMVNGVPTYIPKTPGFGNTQMVPLPEGVRSRTVNGQEAGIPNAPAGAAFSVSPLNVPTQVYAPPQGYQQSGPNAMGPIQGGPNDPRAPQKPAQGYAFAGPTGNRQAPIQGGPQDPQGSEVQRQAVLAYHSEFKPAIEAATKLARNYASVGAGYKQQNGTGDIAMINGLQRLIDEGVVREGDVTLQLKGQGIQGGLSQLQGYLTSKGFFDPQIRNRIKSTADSLYGSIMPNYRDQVLTYKDAIDSTYGQGTFDKVVPPQIANTLGWTGQDDGSQAQGASPAVVAQAAAKAGLPPAEQRQPNRIYDTPRGPMKWTGTGWVRP